MPTKPKHQPASNLRSAFGKMIDNAQTEARKAAGAVKSQFGVFSQASSRMKAASDAAIRKAKGK